MTRYGPKRIRWDLIGDIAFTFGESDRAIARGLGISPVAVAKQRTRRGIVSSYPHDTNNKGLDWANADWALSNRVLAERFGCTPQNVGNRRKYFCGPTDWSCVDWTESNARIARKFGCRKLTVVEKRREARGVCW